jgi:ABC-type lipoprotein release transport system permease subunit
MGIPLLRGRQFAPTEAGVAQQRHGEVAVIIGADLAQRLWAGADPIGRRLRAVSDSATGARTLEVVGVIDDPLADTRKTGENYRIYLPPDTGLTPRALLVRTAGAAQSSIPILRTVVQEEVTGMVASIRSLAEIEEEQRRDVRLGASGISAAGLMALLLSAIGLYAVVTFSVGQRTREIAVRMAVGACDSQIVRRFVADGLRLSAIGLALGLPISLIGLRALLTLDDDFSSVALGPVTAIAMFGVILVATAAAWIPARRAAAVDPAVALRSE